ncbi:unnamed protein product [Ambrosiozyma monospora]|uniref:Unnamed protein product n=1 Tax=Ambrosiozyma monospora TaxID=43982 RepID=A0ACB5SY60_AMBMO|nr:unnamed protein product [Ambrosiozyma monospora]
MSNFNHISGGSGNDKKPNPFDFDDDDQTNISLNPNIPASHDSYEAPARSPRRNNDIEMQHTPSPTTPPFQTAQHNTGSNPVFNPIVYEDRAYASNTGESTSPGHAHGSGYQSPERTGVSLQPPLNTYTSPYSGGVGGGRRPSDHSTNSSASLNPFDQSDNENEKLYSNNPTNRSNQFNECSKNRSWSCPNATNWC